MEQAENNAVSQNPLPACNADRNTSTKPLNFNHKYSQPSDIADYYRLNLADPKHVTFKSHTEDKHITKLFGNNAHYLRLSCKLSIRVLSSLFRKCGLIVGTQTVLDIEKAYASTFTVRTALKYSLLFNVPLGDLLTVDLKHRDELTFKQAEKKRLKADKLAAKLRTSK